MHRSVASVVPRADAEYDGTCHAWDQATFGSECTNSESYRSARAPARLGIRRDVAGEVLRLPPDAATAVGVSHRLVAASRKVQVD